eukprot:jgi/Mesvir1/3916/Mv19858-RA.1
MLQVRRLGLIRYADAWRLQKEAVAARQGGASHDTVITCEHFPVYTLGRRSLVSNLLVDEASLRAAGAELFVTERGGEVTFHGPGQCVLYPIIGLRDRGIGVRRFVERLEDAMIHTVAEYGISARGRVPGLTGVWVDDRKIGAIGVRVSQGITFHGLALNVNTDLKYFDNIVPCGVADKAVTSMSKERGGEQVDVDQVFTRLVDYFADALRLKRCELVPDLYKPDLSAPDLSTPGAMPPKVTPSTPAAP